MEKATVSRKISWKIYSIEGFLACIWLLYLVKFYSFYNEAYFFIDKRLSLFLRLLSFLNDNWQESFVYFILSFLLMTLTFFFAYFMYLANSEKRKSDNIFFILTICYCLALFMNICGFVFFILFVLAASLVYIIFTLANGGAYKEELDHDEEVVLETKGPFETEATAQKASLQFKTQWPEKAGFYLVEEIYLESDGKYYVDLYSRPTKSHS